MKLYIAVHSPCIVVFGPCIAVFGGSWQWAEATEESHLILMRLQKDTFRLILAMLVFKNSVTSKNSSVIYRILLFSTLSSFQFFTFLLIFYELLWQGDFEFCVFVFYYFGARRSHYSLQHWVELRWPCFLRVWLVRGLCFHHDCGAFNGWDLLILSHFRWALLLERQACWAQMGPLCFMDYWLVPYSTPFNFIFPNYSLLNLLIASWPCLLRD